MRNPIGVAALLLALHGPVAFACGFCMEDKIAVTYDHQVLEEAQRRGYSVAYAEITGAAAGNPETAADVQRHISRVNGVIGASVRVSVAPPAVSFAWDSTQHDLNGIVERLNRQLAARQLQLSLLRRWDPKTGMK
jgi:hypothetical protein